MSIGQDNSRLFHSHAFRLWLYSSSNISHSRLLQPPLSNLNLPSPVLTLLLEKLYSGSGDVFRIENTIALADRPADLDDAEMNVLAESLVQAHEQVLLGGLRHGER